MALHDILAKMQEIDGCITVDYLKKKWKSLRTQYLQECRSVKNSKKSGAGVDDVHCPKLWCFDQLKFLHNHVQFRQSVTNVEEGSDDASSPLSTEKVPKKPK
ncbi:uncharacterized protein LOC118751166 [Rhagoletis pomonella]|nr:uncharacterized protein LOC118751166 [Rhagoletis pomonella]